MRKITQDDMDSAARALHMVSAPLSDLRDAVETAKLNPNSFASQVIGKAAAQMLATRIRMGARENPSGRGVRIVHNKLLGGWYVVTGPHQTPLNGRFNSKAEAEAWLQRKNPARKRRAKKRVRRNPSRPLKGDMSAHESAVVRRRHRAARRKHPAYSRPVKLGYSVQVLRGKKWTALATFHHKPYAEEYGRALAKRYPRQKFRLAWE